MKPNAPAIMTIGYEGHDHTQFIAVLSEHEVETLCDVRYRAASRKKGFSKNALMEACRQAGIRYHHERELGTPPEMMKRVREQGGYSAEINEEFRQLLLAEKDGPLGDLSKTAADSITCLLCYEADPADCHRTVVAQEVSKQTSGEVIHL